MARGPHAPGAVPPVVSWVSRPPAASNRVRIGSNPPFAKDRVRMVTVDAPVSVKANPSRLSSVVKLPLNRMVSAKAGQRLAARPAKMNSVLAILGRDEGKRYSAMISCQAVEHEHASAGCLVLVRTVRPEPLAMLPD